MSFTDTRLYFDDVEVGQQWESPGRTVTEADIVNFAGLSGDFNPIHVDHEYARKTPFRKPIAHGLLALSIGSGLGMYCPPMRTLAFLGIKDWQLKEPVFVGDTLHIRCKVQEKEARSRGRRGVISWHRQIINQDDKVVQEGIVQTLVQGRTGGNDASDQA